ncbi:hypothetical protein CBER1_06107 [Cercospora berteroae]|uniref:Glycosyltransferase 2-like domain-containing protein n=1 Tax=Cercospora berteroae TaxID=357750 RepID=A0A2S6C3N2_9PEZI|nr:hypothetical protein CBER1_06107 [Cercospora berteroae]
MASSSGLKRRPNLAMRSEEAYAANNGRIFPEEKQEKLEYKIEETPRAVQRMAIDTPAGKLIHCTLGISLLFYMYCRLKGCIQPQDGSRLGNWIIWLFLACEFIPTPIDFIQYFELTLTLLPPYGRKDPPTRRLLAGPAPTVHIFLTVCGEDEEVIMDTVAGAAVQDYPKTSFRVFVLDDANNLSLSDTVESFNVEHVQRGYLPVVYESRHKEAGVPHYYKSGNLHHGIQLSLTKYGGSEFIAGLDADQIPQSDWLQLTVPHLLVAPELALVSPPQFSYNMPENDILGQDHGCFQNIFEPLRGRRNCSQCNGSGYILRRSALDSIGGWPLCNVGEDLICSTRLLAEGWSSAFIPDHIQAGLAPESFHTLIAQRMRWSTGELLLAKQFKYFLPFLNTTNMAWKQRIHWIVHSLKNHFCMLLLIPLFGSLLLPAVGNTLSSTVDRRQFRMAYLLFFLANRVWQHLMFARIGTGNWWNMERYKHWIIPYQINSVVQSFKTDVKKAEFVVTGSFQDPLNERSEKNRLPFWRRMLDPCVLMHTAYGTTAFVAWAAWIIVVALARVTESSSTGYVHTGLTLRLFEFVLGALVPVRHMAFPSSMPPRQERLSRDSNGIYRPRRDAWLRRDSGPVTWKDAFDLGLILLVDWL